MNVRVEEFMKKSNHILAAVSLKKKVHFLVSFTIEFYNFGKIDKRCVNIEVKIWFTTRGVTIVERNSEKCFPFKKKSLESVLNTWSWVQTV